MHLQGQGSATAAEELVAQEAKEAAKAAAQKAKKQKAKARKQQTLSDATPASKPTSEPSLQDQLDVESIATPLQGSPSQSTGFVSSPDQDTAGKQPQPQHVTVQAPAALTATEDPVLDEPASTTTAAPCGFCAGNAAGAAAADGCREADAKFLDQLFHCPVTKVPLLIHRAPARVSENILVSSDGSAPSMYGWHECGIADTGPAYWSDDSHSKDCT